MPLDKPIIKSQVAGQTTFDYKPREFSKDSAGVARDYVGEAAFRNDFKISELVAQQTGIAQLESDALQERINNQVLERIKEVQEKAYQEGYQLGSHDGAEKAFAEAKAELVDKMRMLEALVKRIEDLKGQLLIDNEAELVSLVYLTAKKIALRDLTENRDAVLEMLNTVVSGIKSDEKIVVRIAQDDLSFIENLQAKSDERIESLTRAKFVADANVQPGGCVIESDFGSVNATVEERTERVWTALQEKIPRTSVRD